MHTETELKFAPNGAFSADLLFSHALIAPFCGEKSTFNMYTKYLDTRDFAIRKAGLSLRLRMENGTPVITLKSKRLGDGALSTRTEWETVSDNFASAASLLSPLGAPVDAFCGKELLVHASVTFTRTAALVTPYDGFSFVLSYDDGYFGENKAHFSEIELELEHGTAAELIQYGIALSQALSLTAEPRSKHARAMEWSLL